MRDYTNKSPVFSESIPITETTDMGHADNINAAPKQLLQNTLFNYTNIEQLHMALQGILENLSALERGSFLVDLVTQDGDSFVTVGGEAFKAVKTIQFK